MSFFSKLLLAANIMAVIALLLCYLASYIDPRTFWLPAFFGLAYPIVLAANLLFVVFWLFSRPRLALLSGVAVLSGLGILMNYVGFRENSAIMEPKSSGNFIRIMTYNVHNFKQFGDQNDSSTKDQILDIIRREQPDIICFQEFFTRKSGKYNFRKLISELMETEYYYFKPSTDNDYESIGMAIFSRFPITATGNIEFAKRMNWNEAVFADINTGKHQFRVYNVHFQSINFQPEDYEYLKKVTKGIDTDVESSKKIVNRLKGAFLKRAYQVNLLRAHADSCETPYIIAGDFNDTPISYTVKTISKDLRNSFREKGSGLGVTYNGEFPNFQIDYIMPSREFEVSNYLIIKKKLSDHYPVRSDLELK